MSTNLLRDLAQMAPPDEHPQLLQQLATALRQGSDEPYSRTASSICPCGVLHIFVNHDEMEQGMAEVRAKKDANDAVLRIMQEEEPRYRAELYEVQRRRAEQKRILADLDEQKRILAEGENELKSKIAEMERIIAERQKSRAEQLRLRAEEDRITGERSAAWATRIKRLEAWNAALAAQLREMSAEKAASAAGAAD
ncbi:uncharacterized protein SCHCODRAFT_02749837 [Schizophyllum commune H4-8]|uniref:Uncharacterized protein n=1 Tax=Schizophyllum commune (strain H4-8 / FGSC 9210) TaxID=578458 RepID=D8QAI7_SCHCM|nr:uncharacterized protein SCHCODRAFT_02749837 [Schizophyllum commune H4-8]KAI5889976.1 hypothetical protein SCHCODRAFT_02749837 [Schizophyllum commune H4-8]